MQPNWQAGPASELTSPVPTRTGGSNALRALTCNLHGAGQHHWDGGQDVQDGTPCAHHRCTARPLETILDKLHIM